MGDPLERFGWEFSAGILRANREPRRTGVSAPHNYFWRIGPLEEELDMADVLEEVVAGRFPAGLVRAVASLSDIRMARSWANSWVIEIPSS